MHQPAETLSDANRLFLRTIFFSEFPKKTVLVLAAMVGVAVVASLSVGLWFDAYADRFAPYPKEWFQVKPGMTSGQARKLLGEPWADGRGLKPLDRWFIMQNCVELRLDLWFLGSENSGWNDENAIVTDVHIWRKASLPWRSRP